MSGIVIEGAFLAVGGLATGYYFGVYRPNYFNIILKTPGADKFTAEMKFFDHTWGWRAYFTDNGDLATYDMEPYSIGLMKQKVGELLRSGKINANQRDKALHKIRYIADKYFVD